MYEGLEKELDILFCIDDAEKDKYHGRGKMPSFKTQDIQRAERDADMRASPKANTKLELVSQMKIAVGPLDANPR